jgi:hypothetical protein
MMRRMLADWHLNGVAQSSGHICITLDTERVRLLGSQGSQLLGLLRGVCGVICGVDQAAVDTCNVRIFCSRRLAGQHGQQCRCARIRMSQPHTTQNSRVRIVSRQTQTTTCFLKHL